jgi:hypothetical protein
MLEILRSEDAVDIMTSVLLKVAKIRIQVGRFGLQNITIGTTTDTSEIRKYTEQPLVALPFKIAIEKMAKTGFRDPSLAPCPIPITGIIIAALVYEECIRKSWKGKWRL